MRFEDVGKNIMNIYKANERPILGAVGSVAFMFFANKFGIPISIPYSTRHASTSVYSAPAYKYGGSDSAIDALTAIYNTAVGMDDSWYRLEHVKKLYNLMSSSPELSEDAKGAAMFFMGELGRLESDAWYKSQISNWIAKANLVKAVIKKKENNDEGTSSNNN